MISQASSEYESQRAAITSIAAKIDCTPKSLRRFVRQQERDTCQRPEPTTSEQKRVKALEQEMRELRKANEILTLQPALITGHVPYY